MAGRKEYELLFKLQAALGGNFNTVFQSALNTTKQMQNSLTKLNSITGKIDAYKKQEAALESNRQKLERLTAEHDKLQREISETAAPSEELRQKMAKNEKQIAATTAKIEAQEQRLQTLGSELSDAGVNTANLSAENERLAKTYDKVKKSQEELAKVSAALEQNNAAISQTKTQLAGTLGTLAALGGAIYAGPVKKAAEFEAQMSTVKAISNASADDMKRLSEEAKHMGATTKFTAVEAGKALEYMAIPRYAEGEYLDSLAELFKGAERLEPEKARTTLQYTLSIPLEVATTIPAGTRATPDGEIVFATLEDLTIPAGQRTGSVEAECQIEGENGNGFIPGQINQPIDVFPYYESVENITESAGGADRESDAAFYERMRESVETYSTAGPLGGYEYFAKSASALIADVKATSPKPGEVDVRVLLTGGELPGEEILKEVLDILNADTVRPLTDHVTVAAPQAVPYNINVTYYTQEGGALSADTIAADVAAAVKSFQKWQAEKMGRDVNPSQLIALLMQTGVKRVEVRSPVFAAVADNAVAQVGTVSVVNGGAERE